MKEGKITERIQKELPTFFKENFVHIMQADAKQRYQFIKQVVEAETKTNWDCDIIQSYYLNEFSKLPDNQQN